MKAYEWFWGSALGVFLVSVVVSIAMMGPPTRKNRFLHTVLAETIAGWSTVIALLFGVLVLVASVPARRSFAFAAQTMTLVVGILFSTVTVYRAIVGANDDRGFDADAVNHWLLGAFGILVLLLGVWIRADRMRRRLAVARRR